MARDFHVELEDEPPKAGQAVRDMQFALVPKEYTIEEVVQALLLLDKFDIIPVPSGGGWALAPESAFTVVRSSRGEA